MNVLPWYNKHYKKLLVIPLLLIVFSLVFMGYFYSQNNDFLKRDVSLTGGTSIVLKTDISALELKERLSLRFSSLDIRSLADNSGKQTHVIITAQEEKDVLVSSIEEELDIKISEDNASIEFTQGSLGEEFYKQLMTSMFFAFLLMALVVFITFGESKIIKVYASILTLISMKLTFPTIQQLSFLIIIGLVVVFIYGFYISNGKTSKLMLFGLLVLSVVFYIFNYYPLVFLFGFICLVLYARYSAPSIAVLVAAFADILFTLVTVNLIGMRVASGGIIAFLMLIGYSVGTDVLLTSRVLRRRKESVNSACFGAFKTGIMMTLTAIISIFVGLIFVYRFETVLNQIFTILLIGLLYDILNTWLTNVWIIKWYAESRNKYDKMGNN
jgi:preprotein translocase subunit SecF